MNNGSAPPSCAGAVCDEESEESANGQAFNYLIGRYTLHESSFGKIEEAKSNTSTYNDSDDSGLKTGCIDGPFNPGSFRFYFKLFKLHICRLKDLQI